MVIWTLDGRRACLDAFTDRSTPDHWTVRLFSNDFRPDGASVLADFTESAFNGYGPVPCGSWGPATDDGEGNAVAQAVAVAHFQKTIGPAIEYSYGYYLTDLDDRVLLAERFPSRLRFDASGDSLDLQLILTLGEAAAG
jgi:hypothetical protein